MSPQAFPDYSAVWRHNTISVLLRLGHKLPEIRLAGGEDDVANDIAEEIKIVVDKRIDQICDTFHLTKQKSNLMKTNLGAAPGRTYLWITLASVGSNIIRITK
jgi:hypothetical protein